MTEIVKPGAATSSAFVVLPGKQVTLRATGLVANDYVEVQIVELSRAPEFTGDLCCAPLAADIVVLNTVPLLCAKDSPVRLTQEVPFVILNGPQLVTLRAEVFADMGALVSVTLLQTDDDGSTPTICQCIDLTWKPTGVIRCVDGNVEPEEISNCGTVRWGTPYPQTWTDTGQERCVGTDVEREEKNDCGATRWVVDRPQTWTDTGQERCVGTDVEREEKNDCGATRWVVDRPQTWTPTGQERCVDNEVNGEQNNDVEREEKNDCGATRWVVDRPQTWTPTGQERCVGTDVEREEKNDCCCETRWVVDRPQTWTDTGAIRCVGTDVEKEQINDCGTTRWVVDRPQTWTPTGQERCVDNEVGGEESNDVEREEKNDCGATRWVVDRPQTWTPTGETRCENNLVEIKEANDCGKARWVVTATVCGFCASVRLLDGGYGYHEFDVRDPAATIVIGPCPGDSSVDKIYVYPTPAPGRTARQNDCAGNLIGYGVNRSDCAVDCGCPEPASSC
jgi:hypothetical protein